MEIKDKDRAVRDRSRLMIAASMAIFGTIGLFVRGIALPSSEIALYRAVLAMLAIGAYLSATRQKIAVAGMKKEILLLLVSGVAMGFNWILLFEAYKYTTVSVATLSYYSAPVMITLVSAVLFREKMTKRKLLCFVMSTLGILLITAGGSDGSGGSGTDHIGIAFGLGAAVLYATVVLLNKFIRKVDGIQRTFLQFAAAAVTLFPYVWLSGGTHLNELDPRGWTLLLIVGLLHTGVTYCMYFSSLQHVTGQEAAILSYIDPLVAVILSVFLLHEAMNIRQVVGGAMILGFTLLNEV